MPSSPWMIGLRLVLYMVTSGAALVLLKTAPPGFVNARFAAGFVLYGLSFGMWWLLLRALPLSVAFPLATGIQAVALQFVGHFVLKERMSAPHLVGLALILGGVALVFIQSGRASPGGQASATTSYTPTP